MTPPTILSRLQLSLDPQCGSTTELLQWIPRLNIAWRKAFLDVCQTGLHPRDSYPIRSAFNILMQTHPIPSLHNRPMTNRIIFHTTKTICSSRLLASIISIHLRSERCEVDDGSLEVLRNGIWKEVHASQTERSPSVIMDAIFYNTENEPYSIYAPISPPWLETCRKFANALRTIAIKWKGQLLYPKYQRKKNMSQESSQMLCSYGYETSDHNTLSTLDLERFYHRTGLQVGGGCEMRWAWKYNDLKPRAYYCIGGSNYWPARFMKRIAVEFMESISTSKVLRRRFPSDASKCLSDNDSIVIWDLSSFTTSLAELNEFLYWSARYLENTGEFQELACFDSHRGVTFHRLSDLIDNYNTEVNAYSGYSLHRLLDDLQITDSNFPTEGIQMNSGMLGVPGNIGFSTAFHAIHTSAVLTDADAGAAIGDDVLGIVPIEMVDDSIKHIQLIGSIPTSKFGIFGPNAVDEGWKFVKRPLRRTDDGFTIGEQVNIPILAYVFQIESENRKFPNSKEPDVILHRFINQVGACLWEMASWTEPVSTKELSYLRSYLAPAYRTLGLWFSGGLPGTTVTAFGSSEIVVNMAYPSIEFLHYNPCTVDWAEYLWDFSPVKYTRLPICVKGPIEISDYEDDTFFATSTRFNATWVDLGYLDEVAKMSEWVEVIDMNKRRFVELLRGGSHQLVKYKWIRYPPPIFFSCTKYFDVPLRSGQPLDVYRSITLMYDD